MNTPYIQVIKINVQKMLPKVNTDVRIKVITNNVPRPIIEGYELTEAERSEFDYIDWAAVENGLTSPEFIRYKGELYDLGEFMTTCGLPEFTKWHSYLSDSFFSGILVNYVTDGDDYNETVIIGRYYS